MNGSFTMFSSFSLLMSCLHRAPKLEGYVEAQAGFIPYQNVNVHVQSQPGQLRAMATVRDSPLDRKVEMTNWEKVCIIYLLPLPGSYLLNSLIAHHELGSNMIAGKLHQLQVGDHRLVEALPKSCPTAGKHAS